MRMSREHFKPFHLQVLKTPCASRNDVAPCTLQPRLPSMQSKRIPVALHETCSDNISSAYVDSGQVQAVMGLVVEGVAWRGLWRGSTAFSMAPQLRIQTLKKHGCVCVDWMDGVLLPLPAARAPTRLAPGGLVLDIIIGSLLPTACSMPPDSHRLGLQDGGIRPALACCRLTHELVQANRCRWTRPFAADFSCLNSTPPGFSHSLQCVCWSLFNLGQAYGKLAVQCCAVGLVNQQNDALGGVSLTEMQGGRSWVPLNSCCKTLKV